MNIHVAITLLCLVSAVCSDTTPSNDAHKSRHHFRTNDQNRIINHESTAENEKLQLYSNSNASMIAFQNSTSAVIFSYYSSSSTSVLLNGENGRAIVVEKNRTVIKSEQVWVASKQSFRSYFQSVSTTETIVQKGQVTSKDESSTAQEIKATASRLGVETNPLDTILTSSRILQESRSVLELIKSNNLETRGSVLRSVLVLKGIRDLLQQNPDAQKNATGLDLSSILNAPNGLQALLRILQSDGNSGLLNSLDNLPSILRIVSELGGDDSRNGVDNVIRIIYSIMTMTRGGAGGGNPDVIIQSLFEIARQGGLESLGEELNSVITELTKLSTETQSSNSGGLRTLLAFLKDLDNNNIIFNGINISRVLLSMRRGQARNNIEMVIRVLMSLSRFLNPTVSIPRFFGFLLNYLNQARPGQFGDLIPGLDPSQLQNLNITQLLGSGNANLSQIPGLGQIYDTVANSVKSASNGSMNFADLLSSNGGGAQLFSNFEHSVEGMFGALGFLSPVRNLINTGVGELQSVANGVGLGPLVPANLVSFVGQLGEIGGEGCNTTSGETETTSSTSSSTTTTMSESGNPTEAEEKHHGKTKNHHGYLHKESKYHHLNAKQLVEHRKQHEKKHHEHEKSHNGLHVKHHHAHEKIHEKRHDKSHEMA